MERPNSLLDSNSGCETRLPADPHSGKLPRRGPGFRLVELDARLRRGRRPVASILLLSKRNTGWLSAVQERLKSKPSEAMCLLQNGPPPSTGVQGGQLPELKGSAIAQGFAFLAVTLSSLAVAGVMAQGFSWALVAGQPVFIVTAGSAWKLIKQHQDPWAGWIPEIIRRKVSRQGCVLQGSSQGKREHELFIPSKSPSVPKSRTP